MCRSTTVHTFYTWNNSIIQRRSIQANTITIFVSHSDNRNSKSYIIGSRRFDLIHNNDALHAVFKLLHRQFFCFCLFSKENPIKGKRSYLADKKGDAKFQSDFTSSEE